jgi:hypothetical protein
MKNKTGRGIVILDADSLPLNAVCAYFRKPFFQGGDIFFQRGIQIRCVDFFLVGEGAVFRVIKAYVNQSALIRRNRWYDDKYDGWVRWMRLLPGAIYSASTPGWPPAPTTIFTPDMSHYNR